MPHELTRNSLTARKRRLDRLRLGLARELTLWQGAVTSPLLDPERRTYLRAVQAALAGVEAAGVTLAGVLRRLEPAEE